MLLSCSSLAPPAGQDGAPAERAAAGEAKAGAPERRGQQHGVRRPPKTLSKSQFDQSHTESKDRKLTQDKHC